MLATLAMGPACHAPASTTAAPTTPAEASAPQTPFSGLNLGFEAADTAEGWEVATSDYAISITDAHAAEGQRSLELVHDGEHERGTATLQLPIETVAAKKLRATVKVRTEGVDRGGVALRLTAARGDDDLGRRETPMHQRVGGDRDWTELSLELAVPADAEDVTLKLLHLGSGTAWFDDVQLSLSELDPAPAPTRVQGRVLGESGKPASEAFVVLISRSGHQVTARTDAQGSFDVELLPGTYAIGASDAHGVGNAGLVLEAGASQPLELTLAPGSQPIGGIVRDQDGRPFEGALAIVATEDERMFPVLTDDDGRWSIDVPAAGRYMAAITTIDGGQRMIEMIDDTSVAIETTLPRDVVAPQAALDWIGEHAVPLRTVEAGQGLDDMTGLDSMVGSATVVGLGETTHGTREFFQMKHRMLEYLVERHGFRVFAIEANRTECRAIDHYIQTGEGDPKDALDGIYFWTWNTHEVLELIEWMRAYNQSHDDPIHFVGFDAQVPDVAARNVEAFLAQVAPDAPEREAVALFGRPWNAEAFAELSEEDRKTTIEALIELDKRFEDHKSAWIAEASALAFTNAREDLDVVRHVVGIRTAQGMEQFSARDWAMADNVLAIERRYGKGTKTVLWAHNGHIARSWNQAEVMGQYLGRALGDDYVSVGFAFDRGGFQAIAMEGNEFGGLREHVVGPAKQGDFEAALREGGPELFALSLRELPKSGDAATFLRSPMAMRQIGAGFDTDDISARVIASVPERFDVMLFVEETTRARPVRR
ncbi:MAG: erythromycin esterase family protein [Myxococcota bacterium]